LFFSLRGFEAAQAGRETGTSTPQETARDAMAAATLAEMEKAASCMIQVIKDTPDLRTTKLAISGDMAIRKYLPEYGHQNAGVSRP